MAKASSERDKNTSVIKNKAAALKESTDKIYRDISTLDTALAKADKYYVKTRAKKIEKLAQTTETSIEGEADILTALQKVKERFQLISSKYSKEASHALVDGIHYLFSSQRKQNYEELIILKNTLEKLMAEIKRMVPELIGDPTQVHAEM